MAHKVYAMTFVVVLLLAAAAQAQTFTTLYEFSTPFGASPLAGLIQDKSGNLYGTTSAGGSLEDGVLFELTGVTETPLVSFPGAFDGIYPYAPVIMDGQGIFYGTTFEGGSNNQGVVFSLQPPGLGTQLHSFVGGTSDGAYPTQGLVRDASGNLYGTTYQGGSNGCGGTGCGVVFKIDTTGKETILHSFAGVKDGAYPYYGHLRLDKAGNLYGVTAGGGAFSPYGVVYKLAKNRALTVLHNFNGTEGGFPYGTVAMDAYGNLYGTTKGGGASGWGTVWKVSLTKKRTILHSFGGGTSDGCNPMAGVVLDANGNVYGNTTYCGTSNYGTVWKLSKGGKYTVLHNFAGTDGEYPYGELVLGANSTLYGTTSAGGTLYGLGTVWTYVP